MAMSNKEALTKAVTGVAGGLLGPEAGALSGETKAASSAASKGAANEGSSFEGFNSLMNRADKAQARSTQKNWDMFSGNGNIIDSIPDKKSTAQSKPSQPSAKPNNPSGNNPNSSQPSFDPSKARCPNCKNVGTLKKTSKGTYKCSFCQWETQAAPQKGFSLSNIGSYGWEIGASIVLAIVSAFLAIRGLLPLTSGGGIIFLLFSVVFVIALFAKKSKLAAVMFVGVLGSLFLFSNIFLIPALAGTREQLSGITGTDVSSASDLLGGFWTGIKCSYYGATDQLTTSGDPNAQKTLHSDCIEQQVDADKNIQKVKSDLTIESFESDDQRVDSADKDSRSRERITLSVHNDGDETKEATINFIQTQGPAFTIDKTYTPSACRTFDHDNMICVASLPAKYTTPITIRFNVPCSDSEQQVAFAANVTYSGNVTTILTIKTTDNDLDKGKDGKIDSIASPGAADLILSAENQPLSNDNLFKYWINIKNNNGAKGSIIHPTAVVALPLSIISKDSAKDACSSGIDPVDPKSTGTPQEKQCYDQTQGLSNYFCLVTSSDVYSKTISENKLFKCDLRTNKIEKEASRTTKGMLSYDYQLSQTSNPFFIEPLANKKCGDTTPTSP